MAYIKCQPKTARLPEVNARSDRRRLVQTTHHDRHVEVIVTRLHLFGLEFDGSVRVYGRS